MLVLQNGLNGLHWQNTGITPHSILLLVKVHSWYSMVMNHGILVLIYLKPVNPVTFKDGWKKDL